MTQTKEEIREFLVEESHWDGARADLTDDLPLIEGNVIDSMLLLRLVAWLESRYNIAIADAEVVPSNFGSIGGISRLVEAKLQQA